MIEWAMFKSSNKCKWCNVFAMKGTFYEGIQQNVKILNFSTEIKESTPSQTPQGSQDFKNF